MLNEDRRAFLRWTSGGASASARKTSGGRRAVERGRGLLLNEEDGDWCEEDEDWCEEDERWCDRAQRLTKREERSGRDRKEW
ncbi:hypothetical protein ACOSP7_031370 [Xanthoceras sorbifolium]